MNMKIVLLVLVALVVAKKGMKKMAMKGRKVNIKGMKMKKQVTFGSLPPTPKGPGAKKVKSIEQLDDDPDKVKLFAVDNDGNYVLQALERKKLNKVGKLCHKIDSEYDEFCGKIDDCSICSSSEKCGWCESTAQCISGDTGGPDCPEDCINGWKFHTKQCIQTVKSGQLGNWAPDASKIINATIVNNEGKFVRVNYYEPKYWVKEQKVQMGVARDRELEHMVNSKFDKQNIMNEFTQTRPLWGKQVIRVPIVNQKIRSKLVDIRNGKEYTDEYQPEKKVLHGQDDGSVPQNFGKD